MKLRGQGCEKICLAVQDLPVSNRYKFGELVGLDPVLVGKNTAAHDIEHGIGEMIGAAQRMIGYLQSIGGGFYFGTGGTGAGVTTYSTFFQFGFTGGLVFKFNKGY